MAITYYNTLNELRIKLLSLRKDDTIYICDSNCHKHILSKLQLPQSTPTFIFSAGEQNKSSDTYLMAIEAMKQAGCSRKSTVVNIGGGVTTDLGGFAAATYMRGIPFINVPTSLMAMVDASIGGKVGINHGSLKNYIGAFAEPKDILICPELLNTLPTEELVSGYAEVLKHGLIADRQYWDEAKQLNIAQACSSEVLEIIRKSIDIKTRIVDEDVKEAGIRKVLNFGHTIGHAIESRSMQNGNAISHGEAVAAGMICEAELSHRKLGLPLTQRNDIVEHILQRFPTPTFSQDDMEIIINLCQRDKKNRSSTMLFSLIPSIGQCDFDIAVSPEEVERALEFYLTHWNV